MLTLFLYCLATLGGIAAFGLTLHLAQLAIMLWALSGLEQLWGRAANGL